MPDLIRRKKKDETERYTDTGTGSKPKTAATKPSGAPLHLNSNKATTTSTRTTPKVEKPGLARSGGITRQTDTGTGGEEQKRRVQTQQDIRLDRARDEAAQRVETGKEQLRATRERLGQQTFEEKGYESRKERESRAPRSSGSKGSRSSGKKEDTGSTSMTGKEYLEYVYEAKKRQQEQDVEAVRAIDSYKRNRYLVGLDVGQAEKELAQLEDWLDKGVNTERRRWDLNAAYNNGGRDGETYQAALAQYGQAAAEAEETKAKIAQLKQDIEQAKSVQYYEKGVAELDNVKKYHYGAWKNIDVLAQRAMPETGEALPASENGTFDVDPNAIAQLSAEADKARAELRRLGYKDEDISKLVDYRLRQLNNERTAAALAQAQEFAKTHPFAASAASVATNLGSGLGVLDAAVQRLRNPDRPYDYNSESMLASNWTNAVRAQVSKDIVSSANDRGRSGAVGNFLYQTGMSMADSLVNMGLAAVGMPEALGLTVLGGSAATASMREAHERGLSDAQALSLGLISGIAEYATERIGLDAFMETLTMKGANRATIVRSLMSNMLAEGGEEVLSDVVNFVADQIIAGDQSEFRKSIETYKTYGLSDAEALASAVKDQLGDTALSFLGGALSGGVMGAGGHIISGISNEQHNQMLVGAMSLEDNNPVKTAAVAVRELNHQITLDMIQKGLDEPTEAQSKQLQEAYSAFSEALQQADTQTQKLVEEQGKKAYRAEKQQYRADKKKIRQEMKFQKKISPQIMARVNEAVNSGSLQFSENATVQEAATIYARNRANVNQATDKILADPEAMQALNLSFPEGTNKPEQKRQARLALDALIQNAKASTAEQMQAEEQTAEAAEQTEAAEETESTEPAAVSAENVEQAAEVQEAQEQEAQEQEAEDEEIDLADMELLTKEEHEELLRKQNPDLTQEQLDKEYDNMVRAHQDAVVRRDIQDRAGKMTMVEGRALSYRTFRSLAQQNAAAKGQTLDEDIIRRAFDTGAEETSEEVKKYEEERKADLEDTVKRINEHSIFKQMGYTSRVSFDEEAFKSGTAVVNAYIDPKSKEIVFNGNRMDSGAAIMWVLGHEVTHKAAKVDTELVNHIIQTFTDLANEGRLNGELTRKMRNLDAEIEKTRKIYDRFHKEQDAKNNREHKEFTTPQAREEFAADLMREAFMQTKLYQEIVYKDAGTAVKMRESLKKVLRAITGDGRKSSAVQKRLQKIADEMDEALSKVSGTESTEDDSVQYSIDSLCEAGNLTFEKSSDGLTILRDANGDIVEHVTEKMLRNSPLGAIIYSAVQKDSSGHDIGLITESDADKQLTFYTQLLNTMLTIQDVDMLWAVSSTVGFHPLEPGTRAANTKNRDKGRFAPYTSNSDPQYKTTVDFTTICLKTQAVIDAMSETMKRLGHGLTEDEIVNIVYREVFEAGEPVPCPVCYVFSRWVGLGGLFDKMKTMQIRYANADLAVIEKDLAALDKKIVEISERENLQNSKARTALYKTILDEYNELYGKHVNDMVDHTDTMTAEEKSRMSQLKQDLEYLDSWTWLKDVRLAPDYEEHGNVPDDVLFDINAGKTFAEQYPLAWKYRTTRGPAMGKAATPYADERIGTMIRGASVSSPDGKALANQKANPYLSKDAKKGKLNKTGIKTLEKARANAKRQNLLNGQRYQSTSDFRFEYALDYLLSFLEMQTIGSKVQLYTKVPEAVPMFASVKAEVNCSLMPLGTGVAVDASGNKFLTFSDVTGMHPDDAFRLSNTYDNVQPILVGISPEHIRLAMADPRISFIIPYHSSGAGEGRYVALMTIVGETVPGRSDFSNYQTDHPIVNPDTVEGKALTAQQEKIRDTRIKLLTGKLGSPTEAQKRIVRNNPILNELYKRFYGTDVDGNLSPIDQRYLSPDQRGNGDVFRDEECFGVFLTSDQAKTIMPFEYWDRTSTLATADDNGRAFVDYCASLGLRPRFSGWTKQGTYSAENDFTQDPGYWKTLGDRRLYNRDGTYHEQQAINATDFKADYLYREPSVRGVTKPSIANDPNKTSIIADRSVEKVKAGRAAAAENDRQFSIAYRNAASDSAWRGLQQAQDMLWDYQYEHPSNSTFVPFEVMEDIRAKTGWWRSPVDQQWRYWISDKDAGWNTDNRDLASDTGELFQLYDVIKHDKLFQDYPQLEDVEVMFYLPKGGSTQGEFSIKGDRWVINLQEGAELNDDTFATLLHEIQHAIQQIEVDQGNRLQGGSNVDVGYKQAFVVAYNDITNDGQDTSMFDGLTYKQAVRKIEQRIAKLYRNSSGFTDAERQRMIDDGMSEKSMQEWEAAERADRSHEDVRGAVQASAYEYYREAIGEIDARFTGDMYQVGQLTGDRDMAAEANIPDRVRYGEETRRGDYDSVLYDALDFKRISRSLGWDGNPEHLHSANYDLAESRGSSAEERQFNSEESAIQEDFSSAERETNGVQFSINVTDPETLKFLNDQVARGEYVTTYKTFLEIVDDDGTVHLYPPMASMQRDENGKKQMAHSMYVGVWEQSVGNPNSKNIKYKINKKGQKKWYYELIKDNGKPVEAAYDPYQHSSNVVLNDQFEEAYQRPKLVTYECIIPKSELTSGYRYREKRDVDGEIVEAALPVGVHPWKKGTIAGSLSNTDRVVYMTRWLMPTRRVDDAEVARMYKEIFDRENKDIVVPFNVVPPGLRAELEKLGVQIDTKGSPMYRAAQKRKSEKSASQKQFSIDPNYAGSIDSWDRDGRPADETFTLGTTGDVLQALGAQERTIYMNAKKVSQIMVDHPNMTLDEIKRLPEVLENPTLILKSRNQNSQGKTDRLVIYGRLKDSNNVPVAVIFDLAPSENGVRVGDMYKVGSAYGKDAVNTPKAVANSYVVFANKKRAPQLLRQLGFKKSSLRVPGPQTAQGSDAGYSSYGSINDAGRNVNTFGAPFGQVFDYQYSLTPRPEAEGEQYEYDPNDDPVMQAFSDAYEEARGKGQLKKDFPTIEQRLREAKRDLKRAEKKANRYKAEQEKDQLAWEMYHKRSLRTQDREWRAKLEKDREKNRKAWEMYYKRRLRTQDREWRAKLDKARRDKIDALRAQKDQFQEQRAIDKAEAEVKLEATQMAMGREAAKRLHVKEDLYKAKQAKQKDRAILRRNSAKAALRDRSLNQKKRAEAEIEQGPVETLRKTAAERKAMLQRETAAGKLRTLGRDLYTKFVSAASHIERFARRQKDGMRADTLSTVAGGVGSTVNQIFTDGLVDRAGNRIGDSMTDVFLCTKDDKGKVLDEPRQQLFQDYLLHRHNIDRMSFVSRAEANLEAFEREHPWLKEMNAKEFARLVALSDTETQKLGQEEARSLARAYQGLLQDLNNARDKAVFADKQGQAVTAETSRAIVKDYEAAHPWLKEKAENLYRWWDRFMKEWVVGDSITEEQYAHMRSLYPSYVPTYRVIEGMPGFSFSSSKGATPGQLVKRATGSFKEIINIEDSFANLVQKAVKQARVNELYKNIVDTAMLDFDGTFADLAYFDWLEYAQQNHMSEDELEQYLGDTLATGDQAGLTKVGKDHKVSAWYNGQLIGAYVSPDLFNSLALTVGHTSDRLDKVAKLGAKLTSPMKTAITGINPNFALRNMARDLPTAVINSTSGLAFPYWWGVAWKNMITNSENWQHYQALGGGDALYYNNEGGYGKALNMDEGAKGKLQRGWNKTKEVVGFINERTEAVTRFAEYLATIHKLGDTYEGRLQGMKNAAEVTVDFSRHGEYGKAINAWIPYWNPAVQGIDKVFRSVIETPQGQTRVGHLLRVGGRLAVTTALAEAVQQIILAALGRDKDWEELNDRAKDTYYYIPLPEEHKFIRIPKNREWGAILGTPLMRLWEGFNGRENPFENYLETSIIPNFLPGSPLDAVGISQAFDIATNKDFAGRTIVPYAYQQGSKKGQYDSDTSAVAKWLSDALGNALSPMQIDYIVQDYYGDFGKMFNMLTSRGLWSGDKDPEDVGEYLLDVVKNPWVSDSRVSNYYTSKYYEVYGKLEDEYNDLKNHADGEDYKESKAYKTYTALKKLYGNDISELSKSIREESDDTVKAVVKGQIAQLAKQALEFYDQCMSGDVKEPELTAKYYSLSDSVSQELIRMNKYAEDYAFAPQEATAKTLTDTSSLKLGNTYTKEYKLDDAAIEQRNALREAEYDKAMQTLIRSSEYASASDKKKAEMLEDARSDAYEAADDSFRQWLSTNRTPTMKDKLPEEYTSLSKETQTELARLSGVDGTAKYKYTPSASTTASYGDPDSKVGRSMTREYVLDDEAKDIYNEKRRELYEQYIRNEMKKSRYANASDLQKAEYLEAAREAAYDAAKEWFMAWLKKNRTSTPKD